MRLSEWRARAPHKNAMTPKVVAMIEPVLTALGAPDDPSCWIVWGDDPGVRYVMLVPSDAGLIQVLVRVNVPGEGPRASAKVIRWHRLQIGELGLEMVSGHRLLGFQVESHVLRGTDADGDAMAAFALELFARIDGRAYTPSTDKGRKAGGAKAAGAANRAGATAAANRAAAKPAAAKPSAPGRSGTGKTAGPKQTSSAVASRSKRSSP